jgi:uncharacterized repeat protein (TIGR03803 family)
LTVGPGGALYGTTGEGGVPQDDGTVYALVPPVDAPPGVIHFFAGGIDGSYPYAPVTGSNGVLYDTTAYGGTAGGGTVFSLKPPCQGCAWTESVLYQLPAGPPGEGQARLSGQAPRARFTAPSSMAYRALAPCLCSRRQPPRATVGP